MSAKKSNFDLACYESHVLGAATHELVTRKGLPVSLSFTAVAGERPLVGHVLLVDGSVSSRQWLESGDYATGETSSYDLFIEPIVPKSLGWAVMLTDGPGGEPMLVEAPTYYELEARYGLQTWLSAAHEFFTKVPVSAPTAQLSLPVH